MGKSVGFNSLLFPRVEVDPYLTRLANFTPEKKKPVEKKEETPPVEPKDTFVREDDPTLEQRRKFHSLIG